MTLSSCKLLRFAQFKPLFRIPERDKKFKKIHAIIKFCFYIFLSRTGYLIEEVSIAEVVVLPSRILVKKLGITTAHMQTRQGLN